MLQQHPNNDVKIKLPNSPYINVNLGLEHLNYNRVLYLKILHSFIGRYKDLNLKLLNQEELNRTLHTMKGLTATLGMESLTYIVEQLEKNIDEVLLRTFTQQFDKIVIDIENIT